MNPFTEFKNQKEYSLRLVPPTSNKRKRNTSTVDRPSQDSKEEEKEKEEVKEKIMGEKN